MKINSIKFNILLLTAFLIVSTAFTQPAAYIPADGNAYYSTPGQQGTQQKKDKKKRDDFKVFGGVSFNNLIVDSKLVKPQTAVGWLLGASYKRGRFFYWELGATYHHAVYNLKDTTMIPGSNFDGVFGTNNINVPVKFGLNFLFFISRIVGLRVYVGAVPSFTLGVGENKLNITMDKLNTFNLYGQGGIGVDVAFIFVEAGYNYGFMDVFKNHKSNPNQIFVTLGFRF